MLSLLDHRQNLSLGTILIDNAAPCSQHDNVVCDHSCDECKRSNEPSACHRLESILRQLVQVGLRTKECQVYQFWPNTSTSRQFTVSSSSFLKLWSSKHGLETSCDCSIFLSAISPNLFHVRFYMSFHVVRPSDCLGVRYSSKYTWSENDFGSPRSTSFINFFHVELRFCFFLQSIWCHPRIPKRMVLVSMNKMTFSNRYLFHPGPNELFSNCLFR